MLELILAHKEFTDIRSIPGVDHVSNIEFYSEFVMKEIRDKEMCKGISLNYVQESLKSANMILMLIGTTFRDEGMPDELYGFATLQTYSSTSTKQEEKNLFKTLYSNNFPSMDGNMVMDMGKINLRGGNKSSDLAGCLYVDVICTNPGHGFGKYMMNEIKLIKDVYGFQRVCLCSLEDAMLFYDKLGFEVSDDDNLSIRVCGTNMPFMTLKGGKRQRKQQRRHTRKSA